MAIAPWYKKRLRWLGKDYRNIDALLREIDVIPFHVARQLLAPMTWQEFIDMLNIPSTDKRHLVTEAEEDFRDYEKTNPGAPFFRKREIADSYVGELTQERHDYIERFFNIDYDEWLRWANNNYDMLPEGRGAQDPILEAFEEARKVIENHQQICTEYEAALAHEKAENDRLRARVAELENSHQKATEGAELANLPTNIKTVLDLLQAGKTDREIAEAFYQDGRSCGLSQAQIGALLWRGKEFPAQQSGKNHGAELVGKPSKSTVAG